jgi:hypothetical protein
VIGSDEEFLLLPQRSHGVRSRYFGMVVRVASAKEALAGSASLEGRQI